MAIVFLGMGYLPRRDRSATADGGKVLRILKPPNKRSLADKLQELALRAPTYLIAIERIVDFALTNLTEHPKL